MPKPRRPSSRGCHLATSHHPRHDASERASESRGLLGASENERRASAPQPRPSRRRWLQPLEDGKCVQRFRPSRCHGRPSSPAGGEAERAEQRTGGTLYLVFAWLRKTGLVVWACADVERRSPGAVDAGAGMDRAKHQRTPRRITLVHRRKRAADKLTVHDGRKAISRRKGTLPPDTGMEHSSTTTASSWQIPHV